ncbi:MAG: 30S ribosomal protein S27ae [Nitrososphaerota archaeon]
MAKGQESISRLFKVSEGNLVRLRRECPRCGKGTYLAEHADRRSCGKCGYMEYKRG